MTRIWLIFLLFNTILLSACKGPQQKKVATIGFLDFVEDATLAQAKQGFYDALLSKGYSEQRGNVHILYRNAQGDQPTLLQACDYFVAEKVDLIAANTTLSTITAVQKTKTIPVFMMVAPRPDLAKLTDAKGNAPANLFGTYEILSYIDTSVMLIKSLKPNTKRIGTIYNQSEPQSVDALNQINRQCKLLGMELIALPVNNSSETQLVTQTLVSKGVDAFFALPDNVIFASFETVAKVCNEAQVPIFTCEAGLVQRGSVAAFGADMYQWGYQSGLQAATFLQSATTAGLHPEMVKIRKRVFNREAAKRFNLKLDTTFTAVDAPIVNINNTIANTTPQELTNFYIAALLLGLGLAAMALGIFISMKIFNIPDITTDGSYTLGAVITGVLLSAHIPTPFVLIGSMLAGALAGSFTGLIHTRLKVNPLLSGILVMTALYSINLSVLGRSNLPLLKLNNIFEEGESLMGHRFGQLAVLLLVIGAVWLAISWLLRTDFGLSMRATGNSESMVRALGVNTNNRKVIGLALANGLTALSGSLIAQYQGFVDINMGIGIVIAGLGAVMIGETFIKSIGLKSITWNLLGVIIGSILFRLILAFTLAAGLNPNLIKLVTALLVLIAVSTPALRKR